MANIQDKLAESLVALQRLQNDTGLAVIRSSQMSRAHLSRLTQAGFIQEVIKGWYISSRPGSASGDTTSWYTSFWYFIVEYAGSRFGNEWCLTPEQSLLLHSGKNVVPKQVIIRSPKGANNIVQLPFDTSLLDIKTTIAAPVHRESHFGLNLYTLPEALTASSPDIFRSDAITARTCLSLIRDASDILNILLEKGQSTVAGRIAGAFRSVGNTAVADEIVATMKSLGYDIRESNPFSDSSIIEYTRSASPYTTRLKLMWNVMRETVINNFPKPEKTHVDVEHCLKHIDRQYQSDAYHSLSIEGYLVSNELIERVKAGDWQPEKNASDLAQKNAMAAHGYWQAFQAVKESIIKILNGANAGVTAETDHRIWYRELFSPSVVAGLLKPADLAGYRSHQVYIRNSMHTPLNPSAVRDAMPTLFELMKNEPDAAVRAILGHFLFVYIHPYMDGNGRIARFLMNTQLISGGYDWVIVPVEQKDKYMTALEQTSVYTDIEEFTKLIASFINN
ncbi:MAG: Fic family protein [Prevotellaceae bacterium]|jgi:fido (protein-threonine AMPylation protein)|nr:Fic family protein [Prevotellaceae bacterium]